VDRGRDYETDGMEHMTIAQLDAGLDHIRRSPSGEGTVVLIVARPAIDELMVLNEGRLETGSGLAGTAGICGSAGRPPTDRRIRTGS
jgi:hypothetical protein